jgi:hypothetical protein
MSLQGDSDQQMAAQEQFAATGLVDWDLNIDRSDANALHVTLIVKTDCLRHTILVTGLEDDRTLGEVFSGVPEIRIAYTGSSPFQYSLRLISNYWDVEFPVYTFHVDTRPLHK